MCFTSVFTKPKPLDCDSIAEWYNLSRRPSLTGYLGFRNEITHILHASMLVSLCNTLFRSKMGELCQVFEDQQKQTKQSELKLLLIERHQFLRTQFKDSIYKTTVCAIALLFISSLVGAAGGGIIACSTLGVFGLYSGFKACTGIYHYQDLIKIE